MHKNRSINPNFCPVHFNYMNILMDGCVQNIRPRVGVTKAPFVNFSVTGNFDIAKV